MVRPVSGLVVNHPRLGVIHSSAEGPRRRRSGVEISSPQRLSGPVIFSSAVSVQEPHPSGVVLAALEMSGIRRRGSLGRAAAGEARICRPGAGAGAGTRREGPLGPRPAPPRSGEPWEGGPGLPSPPRSRRETNREAHLPTVLCSFRSRRPSPPHESLRRDAFALSPPTQLWVN